MLIPQDLLYTPQHEWVRLSNGVARVGITDYAQDALGDVVFVGVPTLGATVTADESFTEVESTKSVSDIYAPVAGTITAVNEALATQPELLNKDPYGAGWICEITLEGAAPALMDAQAYEQLLAG
ncbi:MAG: glycine cleavage system protein GcvH [Ilumatobacteraceae bacterium]|jgi:glycine cleavage system H protein|nr:glycine cleavage system H protein [Actinomycetes bacterium]